MSVRTRVAKKRRKNFIKLLAVKEWPSDLRNLAFYRSNQYIKMIHEIQEILRKHFYRMVGPIRVNYLEIYHCRNNDMVYFATYEIAVSGYAFVECSRVSKLQQLIHMGDCESLTQFTARFEFDILKRYSEKCASNPKLVYSKEVVDAVEQVFYEAWKEINDKINYWRDNS